MGGEGVLVPAEAEGGDRGIMKKVVEIFQEALITLNQSVDELETLLHFPLEEPSLARRQRSASREISLTWQSTLWTATLSRGS